ncbi:MAG: hypothetical protein AB8B55_13220 [Mariniblastus sp.]
MKQKLIIAEQIKEVTFKRTSQMGNPVLFDLNVKTTAKETITIGKRVQNEATCRAIVNDIEQHLGIETSSNPLEKADDSQAAQPATAPISLTIDIPTGFDTYPSQ